MFVDLGRIVHHNNDGHAHVASNAERDEKAETAHERDLIALGHFEKGKEGVEGRESRGHIRVRVLRWSRATTATSAAAATTSTTARVVRIETVRVVGLVHKLAVLGIAHQVVLVHVVTILEQSTQDFRKQI